MRRYDIFVSEKEKLYDNNRNENNANLSQKQKKNEEKNKLKKVEECFVDCKQLTIFWMIKKIVL